jgi:pimeloyl-ACP methyl ester carboxylesterase
LHNPKLPHRLHKVTCPTLLLRGAHDGLISAEYIDRYAALLPNAHVVTLPDAAHLP